MDPTEQPSLGSVALREPLSLGIEHARGGWTIGDSIYSIDWATKQHSHNCTLYYVLKHRNVLLFVHKSPFAIAESKHLLLLRRKS